MLASLLSLSYCWPFTFNKAFLLCYPYLLGCLHPSVLSLDLYSPIEQIVIYAQSSAQIHLGSHSTGSPFWEGFVCLQIWCLLSEGLKSDNNFKWENSFLQLIPLTCYHVASGWVLQHPRMTVDAWGYWKKNLTKLTSLEFKAESYVPEVILCTIPAAFCLLRYYCERLHKIKRWLSCSKSYSANILDVSFLNAVWCGKNKANVTEHVLSFKALFLSQVNWRKLTDLFLRENLAWMFQ